jgi:hypothetical protein
MALSWSDRRKYTYSSVVILILLALVWGLYSAFFSAAPLCSDGVQNGDEQGVDCGGSCSLLCTFQTKEPVVSWARSFLTSTSTDPSAAHLYTAAAYVQNPNIGAGAHRAAYSFQLFDTDNHLIVEKAGITELPPVPTVPIIEPNIKTGSRTVARTLFTFSALPSWHLVAAGAIPRMEIGSQQLSSDGSRLSLVLSNNTTQDARNVTVVGVLFDAQGAALAASKSVIPVLGKKSSQDVVFTWGSGTTGVVRAEIILLPSF